MKLGTYVNGSYTISESTLVTLKPVQETTEHSEEGTDSIMKVVLGDDVEHKGKVYKSVDFGDDSEGSWLNPDYEE